MGQGKSGRLGNRPGDGFARERAELPSKADCPLLEKYFRGAALGTFAMQMPCRRPEIAEQSP